jgi:mono/diheme cytochrome c family protein
MPSLRKLTAPLLAAAALAAPGLATRADEGEKLVQESCGKCHDAKTRPLSAYHLTREKWKETVERMEDMGADIPGGKEREVILDYLARAHGPTSPSGEPQK